jgi:hypothetical protein
MLPLPSLHFLGRNVDEAALRYQCGRNVDEPPLNYQFDRNVDEAAVNSKCCLSQAFIFWAEMSMKPPLNINVTKMLMKPP